MSPIISHIWQRAAQHHEQLAHRHVLSEGKDRSFIDEDIAGRLLSLHLLAGLLVPFFVFEFVYTGYPLAAALMAITGMVMLSSFFVFKALRNISLSRDIFLGALFSFLIWEAFYFDSIYSPGSVWLVALPVVSVLLGSARAGACWLLIVILSLFIAFALVDQNTNDAMLSSGDYHLLYTVSVTCMIVAIFLFVLMVDAARSKAFLRLRQAKEEIQTLAERDDLTGLFNRRAFCDQLDQKLNAKAPAEEVVVLLADLDGFKEINDTYGHQAGDALITAVTTVLERICSQKEAFAARLGGDEFAVCVQGEFALRRSKELAAEVLELVQKPFDLDGRHAVVGISIGLVSTRDGSETSELLRRADTAMYEAKQRGKNQLCCYDSSLDVNRAKRRSLAEELAAAVDAGEVCVHYQPIVDAKSREIIAVEALARWTTSDGQVVSPGDFIPIAEETGLINRLGMHVLKTACRDAGHWGEIKVSVNLSPLQLKSPTLIDDLQVILEEAKFPPERLELELTETHLVEQKERAQPIIEALKATGIGIALDDFGTGYSSIGYLRQYQFDRMKIDRSLVTGLANDPAAQNIVQATALLANSLSLNLTAEGVEDEEEANLLRLIGCRDLQGYYFGKPQPAESVRALLTSATLGQSASG